MISRLRTAWQIALFEPLSDAFMRLKVMPNHLTLFGIAFGIISGLCLTFELKSFAIISLVISGLLDATDGTLARKLNLATNRGCILDIFGDRVVEAAVVLGLFLYEPSTRGWPTLLLFSSFYLCITTFLLSGIFEKNSSEKSFHYSPGLIERPEAFAYFCFVIIFDELFLWATLIFSSLVMLTAIIRLIELLRFHPNASIPSISPADAKK